jgi:hypothetical protein
MNERDEHPNKHRQGRSFTNLGISIDWRFEHLQKHSFSNDWIESGKQI